MRVDLRDVSDSRCRFVVVPVGAAFGWWLTSLPPFSTAATTGVLFAGLAVIFAGSTRRRRRGSDRSRPHAHLGWGLAAWAGVFAAVVALELLMLFSQPRATHPTFSSITDPLQAHHVVRLAFFLGWAALGMSLAS